MNQESATHIEWRFLGRACNQRVSRAFSLTESAEYAPMSGDFEPITKAHRFQLHPYGVHDGYHWSRLEFKRRQHRTELVNRQRIVAVQHHVSAPVAHSNDEQLDLEVVRRLPLREHVEDPLLSVLVLQRRSLRPFVPAEHVLHRHLNPPCG